MARVRVPIVTGIGGLQAAMPTFSEVPGSYLPVIPGKVSPNGILAGIALSDPALATVTVLVDVPDDELNIDGTVNNGKVKQKYPSHFLSQSGRFG